MKLCKSVRNKIGDLTGKLGDLVKYTGKWLRRIRIYTVVEMNREQNRTGSYGEDREIEKRRINKNKKL